MPRYSVDGLTFHSEDLSEEGLAVLETLKYTANELQRLEKTIAVLQTSKQLQIEAVRGLLAGREIDQAEEQPAETGADFGSDEN